MFLTRYDVLGHKYTCSACTSSVFASDDVESYLISDCRVLSGVKVLVAFFAISFELYRRNSKSFFQRLSFVFLLSFMCLRISIISLARPRYNETNLLRSHQKWHHAVYLATTLQVSRVSDICFEKFRIWDTIQHCPSFFRTFRDCSS